MRERDDDLDEVITTLLGRPPQGGYRVVVESDEGQPVVLQNDPFLDDGRPMPTRYWLVDPHLRVVIGRLESTGAVRRSEAEVGIVAIAAAHDAYAAERDAVIPATYDGPRPSGGVGGTRRGVKCLHAHYAWYLAGGDDPVGRWVHERLDEMAAAEEADDRNRDRT